MLEPQVLRFIRLECESTRRKGKWMADARILVVDDNPGDVHLLRMALQDARSDYELQILRTGGDALRFIREHERRESKDNNLCVILLDLHLPQHDGLAVLKAIRESSDLAHVDVVVLSGFASPQEKQRIQSLGATFLQKPRELSDYFELAKKVMEVCGASSVQAA